MQGSGTSIIDLIAEVSELTMFRRSLAIDKGGDKEEQPDNGDDAKYRRFRR